MPTEKVTFSSKEHDVLERVAQVLGLSLQEATEFLAKKALEKRANRPVRVVPAQVVPFRTRSKA